MKYKSAPARLKADEETTGGVADDGTFEAIVAVFGNKDSVGDIVLPGAFADTIASWKASKDPIPVWWHHRIDDPAMNIGVVDEIEELDAGDERIPDWADPWVGDNGGLWVKGRIDVGEEASVNAVAARRLLASRRVTQFSYAYDVDDGGYSKTKDAYELRKIKLYEVSPTPIGANNMTELVGAKALRTKAGRTLSAKNESAIREAVRLLGDVLAALDSGDEESPEEDGNDTGEEGPVKDEEPPTRLGAKSEEPAHLDAASVRLMSDLHRTATEIAFK